MKKGKKHENSRPGGYSGYEYVMDVGAADKAAILLVKVQPYQLLVSDM